MKHRLPKPKSSKSGHRKRREATQAELEINGDAQAENSSDMESYSDETTETAEQTTDPSPEASETEESEKGAFSHLAKPGTGETGSSDMPETTDRLLTEHEVRPPTNPEWENSLPPADDSALSPATEGPPVISTVSHPRRVQPPPLPFQPLPGQAAHPGSGHADEHSPLLIQTHGLVKQYGGRRVVNGVDIHV